MAENIFGTTPFSAAMEGYSKGVEVQTYKEKDKARTSLLSDQAELSRMNVKSIKDDAALKLQERNLEAQTLFDNPELQVKTGQQRDGFLSSLLTKPEVRNNPLLAAHIIDKQKKNQLDLADSYVAKGKVEATQKEEISTALNQILLNPTSEESIASLNDLANRSDFPQEERRNLLGLRDTFLGKGSINRAYWSDPNTPQTFKDTPSNKQEEIIAKIGIAYGLNKAAARDTVSLQDELRKQSRDADIRAKEIKELSVARQRFAASREGNKIKGDKARDNSKKLADVEVQYTKNLNSIDQKQRKILQDNGVATPDDQTDNWFFANTDKLPAPEKAAYESLTLEKQLIQEGYERAKAKLVSADETPPPKLSMEYTKENPAQVKVKSDVEKLPKGAFFRNPADGKIYLKDK